MYTNCTPTIETKTVSKRGGCKTNNLITKFSASSSAVQSVFVTVSGFKTSTSIVSFPTLVKYLSLLSGALSSLMSKLNGVLNGRVRRSTGEVSSVLDGNKSSMKHFQVVLSKKQ